MVVVGLACGFESGGVATSTASIGSSVGDGDDGSDETTGGGSSATAATSASGGLESTHGTDTTDPTEASSPTGSSDPTGASVTTSEETSASDVDTGSTGAAGPIHLQVTDQSNCSEPLWCHFGTDVWDPAGNPTYSQQCFIAPIAPPYELTSVHYVVAATAPEVNAFILEVRSRSGGAPGGVVSFAQLTANDATAGSHEYVFAPPLVIGDPEFCIGFATPYQGLAGALGMAVDVGTAVGNASYIRIEGGDGCNVATWTDVIDGLDPNPSGNWCIDVDIQPLL